MAAIHHSVSLRKVGVANVQARGNLIQPARRPLPWVGSGPLGIIVGTTSTCDSNADSRASGFAICEVALLGPSRPPIRVDTMAKRRADALLEELPDAESPASKRSKIVGPEGLESSTNGIAHLNGDEREHDERRGNDILAAADQEEEELEEAADASDAEEAEQTVSAYLATKRQDAPTAGYNDLYLDTINRSVLDFDFEKLCSISLANINVYACLVCGRYYQGRGPKSHAYFHALEVGHHVYINMETRKVYVLPEGYEVKSKSLDDIKFVVDPRLSKEEVLRLDIDAKDASDLSGKRYRPGMLLFQRKCKS